MGLLPCVSGQKKCQRTLRCLVPVNDSVLLVCHLMASEKCERCLAGSLGKRNTLITCDLCSGVQVCFWDWVSAVLLYLMVFFLYLFYKYEIDMYIKIYKAYICVHIYWCAPFFRCVVDTCSMQSCHAKRT